MKPRPRQRFVALSLGFSRLEGNASQHHLATAEEAACAQQTFLETQGTPRPCRGERGLSSLNP